MRLDSFFSGALCVMSGGRLPAALFSVFLLDSKGPDECISVLLILKMHVHLIGLVKRV